MASFAEENSCRLFSSDDEDNSLSSDDEHGRGLEYAWADKDDDPYNDEPGMTERERQAVVIDSD